jgi:predicted lactoylglutathione lyase
MKQVFINLPVENPEKSMNFYTQLGFSINPLFTDDDQKCMVWSEHIYVMLMPRERFNTYSGKTIPDLKKYEAANYTLPVESLDRVNEMADSGLKAGGTEPVPMTDHGFMQLRKLEDPDGHTWDIIFLDMTKFEEFKQRV